VARDVLRRLAAAVLVATAAVAGARAQDEPGSPRSRAPITILQINDVYQISPVNGLGGLARVATIKKQLQAAGRAPLLVLAGDFLSSSVASAVFKGEQMIDTLNAAGLDLATFGNHEFDFGDDLLIERMKQSHWQWVAANVIDRRTGKPLGGAAPYVVRAFGTIKVGFIGLCLTTTEISMSKLTHTQLVDPMAAAARYIPVMQREGAQVIVAVTHLTFAQDQELVRRFPQIDLIIGGHEHFPITAAERHALISKAGSDARFVARIDMNLAGVAPARRYVERLFELIPVTADIADDPATAEVVKSWEAKLGDELKEVVGETSVPLDAASVRLRAREMPIGNLFADALRAATDADVALMNAGSIRGDRVYPAGPLTRETLLAMHPFGNIITVVEVPGSVLLSALTSGVSKLPASAGQFPQVSGVTMTVDPRLPPARRVSDVKVGGQPLDIAKMYKVAIPDYVFNGGDSYTMFKTQKVLVTPESGPLLVTALEKYVASRKTVSAAVEGRIRILPQP
jgi:5'-nucleotidase